MGPYLLTLQENRSLTIKLRKRKPEKKVEWTSDTVDNEHMGRRSSKCECGVLAALATVSRVLTVFSLVEGKVGGGGGKTGRCQDLRDKSGRKERRGMAALGFLGWEAKEAGFWKGRRRHWWERMFTQVWWTRT